MCLERVRRGCRIPAGKYNGVGVVGLDEAPERIPRTPTLARYPAAARFFEESFGPGEYVEDLVTAIHKLIGEYENGKHGSSE